MMRNKTASSMQKTYDECYLACSTAVYFEGQGNESEALRSWRSALDQISYFNAYKAPSNARPKSETEKALQDSLRDLETQCRDRVNLLEALRQSRKEVKEDGSRTGSAPRLGVPTSLPERLSQPTLPRNSSQASLGYPDLSKPPSSHLPPPLPQRPAVTPLGPESVSMRSSNSIQTTQVGSPLPYSPPLALPVLPSHSSRTPSPDKKGRMLTTLRTKDGKKPIKTARDLSGRRVVPPPASSKAAGLAWDINPKATQRLGLGERNPSSLTVDSGRRASLEAENTARPAPSGNNASPSLGGDSFIQSRSPTTTQPPRDYVQHLARHKAEASNDYGDDQKNNLHHINQSRPAQPVIDPSYHSSSESNTQKLRSTRPGGNSKRTEKAAGEFPTYMKEYPAAAPSARDIAKVQAMRAGRPPEPNMPSLLQRQKSPQRRRRPMPNSSSPMQVKKSLERSTSSDSAGDDTSDSRERRGRPGVTAGKSAYPRRGKKPTTPDSDEDPEPTTPLANMNWEDRLKYVKKHLPKGVDEHAARNIFNEIVVHGDEVHWEDVAGLDVAKKALKEAVVYPFLRPDLFLGLREPARGMLLFGPPGTGKTMLARAVATESRSTFFAISASSLTSKWLGESEKLVRALFSLAKALAPSIIFVDEIDSLLSSRGGSSEHESTRRIKTEFLIQWSDLQRAAAGKQQSEKEILEGDPSRVLVLAATNCPWAIDEAARRRFVRRQYIPLPEAEVRESQLQTLLSHQKHNLNRNDIKVLVQLTDGFSGSDITALAKDAAMGPLRSLGEALLFMKTEEIRPINFGDFEDSLMNIRPSVSKSGLKEFEEWAKEFGERAG